MEKLNELYNWLASERVLVSEQRLPFDSHNTRAVTVHINDADMWGIFLDKDKMNSTADEAEALYHEAGHYATGATHAVHSPFDLVEKHEYKANKWAVQNAISEDELDEAVASGCADLWSLSEHFNYPPDFIKMAVCWYVYGNLNIDLYF